MVYRFLHIIILFLALIYPGTEKAFSQPPKRLSHVSYNVNEGLLHSQVIDIAEDGYGFIWLSTGNGVQRFDGTHFHKIAVSKDNKGIPNDNYVRFFRLQNGNILLKHQRGISEYNSKTNRFSNVIQLHNTNPASDFIICEDNEGIWYNEQNAIYKINKRTHTVTDSIIFKLMGNEGIRVPVAVGDPEKGFSHFIFFSQKNLNVFDRITKKEKVIAAGTNDKSFYEVRHYKNDTLLIATPGGIKKLDLQSGIYSLASPLINARFPSPLTLLNNGLWIVTEGPQMYELDIENGRYITRLVDLQKKPFVNVGYITGVFQDRNKNLWILTENDGIRRINYNAPAFRYFGTGEKGKDFVKSIYVNKEENVILCGTFGNGLSIFDSTGTFVRNISKFPLTTPPQTVGGFHRVGPYTYLIFLQGNWNVYLLNTRSFTLKKIYVDTSHVTLTHLADYHLSIHSLSDSVFVMQNSFHAYKITWHPPNRVRILLISDLPAASVASCLPSNRKFWIGGRDGKYFIFPPGFNTYKEFSLPEKILIRCLEDDQAGRMWIGTENGLFCSDPQGKIIRTINKSHGLPDENIYAIREDEKGNLWVSHNKGISCITENGAMLHFNKMDGLQENEFNTNTSFKTKDGELFFGGVNGISSFYPHETISKTTESEVFLTGIKIKDMDWVKDTAYWNLKKMVLPHHKNTLSFDFTTIGAGNIHNYQYKISGQDEGWVNSGAGKQMRYVLQPGEYVLRYSAGNGLNPLKTKELIIIIKPPFWQTTWFILISILFLTALVILVTRKLTRSRLKDKIRELERIRALDEERMRISREMHDDIGAGLTQIILICEAAKTASNRLWLNEIANTSRKLVANMNEIIWSMNPENNTLEQLLGYMREQLHQLLEHSGIDYSIDFPEVDNNILLDNAQRRNLLLVNKEIVHNAVKHSKASRLSISGKLNNYFLEFFISDNGNGFDITKTSNGYGLKNIRRRIEELGGTLEVRSSDQGSLFILKIPLHQLNL